MRVRAWCPNCRDFTTCTELDYPYKDMVSVSCDCCYWRFVTFVEQTSRLRNDVKIEAVPKPSPS